MSTSGYSSTPLAKKLGLKDFQKVLFIGQPGDYFQLFPALPEIEVVDQEATAVDFIQFFTKSAEELKSTFPLLKGKLNKAGMLWVSWPKKASKVATDLNENIIRDIGLEAGLVDVKVCAVNEIWSGLKFVYRTKDR